MFERIASDNFWNSRESISGPGSELARTQRYRNALIAFLDRHRIESLFDAPCGDLNWMNEVLDVTPVRYIGGDISKSVIESARKRRPDLDLREFDICRDAFPHVQVWHCRDAFLHLCFEDIWAALENAARSSVEFALLTTYRARLLKNVDVQTGGWRYIDLERPPFDFPRPLQYLDDSYRGEFPRAVGVWPISAIRGVVSSHEADSM